MSKTPQKTIPRHVAIIMDGNGRWAVQQKKPRWRGHQAGAEAFGNVVKAAVKANIEVLSVFAFSSENWKRPKEEVQQLMKLFLRALKNQVKELHRNNIFLKIIGDVYKFPVKIQQYITKAEKLTERNTGLKLIIAANYGGHWDIVQAAQQIAKEVKQGNIHIQDIDEKLFSQYLTLSNVPYPDLFIRTSGEQRISNFFLWQLAYSELYFTDILWPDFNDKAFLAALEDYAKRSRRFGAVDTEGN